MVGRAELRRLYKGFMQEGRKLRDFNQKKYIVRRCNEDFRAEGLSEDRKEELYQQGLKDLEVVKRLGVLQQMFYREASYMEDVEAKLA